MRNPIVINLIGTESVCRIARRLIREGADPCAITSIIRDGTPCFKPLTLGRWAALSTDERTHGTIRIVRHRTRTVRKSAPVPAVTATAQIREQPTRNTCETPHSVGSCYGARVRANGREVVNTLPR